MQKFSQLLEKYYKYLLAGLVLAIPLYPKFPFLTVPGTYVSIRLEDFLLAGTFFLLLPYLIKGLRSIFQKDIERSIILYLAIGGISLLSAILLTRSVQVHIGILHLARRVEYFLPFFLGVYAFRKRDSHLLEFLVKVLMITIVGLFIYGLGQRYLSWPVIITQNQEYAKGIALRWIPGSHITSTFAGHYDLSTFLVLTMPIFVALFLELKGRITKLILLGVILCGFWLLVNAVSRISTVSFLVGIVSTLLLLKRHKAIPIVLLISILLLGLSSDLRGRYFRVFSVVKNKIDKLIVIPKPIYAEEGLPAQAPFETAEPPASSVTEDRSTSIRFNVEWPRALRAYAKNPLLGTGYSSITLATDNDYLRALGETGILGFLALTLIFFRIGTLICNRFSKVSALSGVEKAFLAGAVGSLPGIFLNAAFIDVLEASKFAIIFWLVLGIVVGMLRSAENEQNV